MGTSLRTKLFLLVIISISMAAVPIIFSAYEDFRISNIELEKRAFRGIASLIKENIESRYIDILTSQADYTLQRKTQLRRVANMLDSNLKMLEKLPKDQQQVFLHDWISKLQELDLHIEIFDPSGKQLINNDELFSLLLARNDIVDFQNNSLQTLLSNNHFSKDGEFIVFDHEAFSISEPVLLFLLKSPKTKYTIIVAIHIANISKDSLTTETQLTKVIQEKIHSFTLHKDGFIAVFNNNGTLLAHKGHNTGKESKNIPQKLIEEAKHVEIAEGMFLLNEIEHIVLVSYFKSLDWYIVTAAPQSEIEAPTRALIHQLVGIAIAAILNSLLITLILTARLIKPLQTLTQKTLSFAELNFASPKAEELAIKDLPIERSDEVGQLARAFSMMGKTLSQNIRVLMETTTIKERMLGELNAAREIQVGILPSPNALSLNPQYDISAFLEPAKEVGGDFYDFFTSPEGKQVVVIGDVSGKGIPAALFMSMTVTLIRYVIAKGLSPAEAAGEINKVLSENNPSCMFVTLFIGIFDPKTGELVYVNCGHCLPYIINKQNEEKIYTLNNTEQNPIIGVLQDITYVNSYAQLEKHDICLLYTDGVIEAMDNSLELFGELKLQKTLENNKKKSLRGILAAINQSITTHRGDAEQSDDITMLSFSRR